MRLALAQLRSNLFEKETNLRRVIDTISLAREKGAEYVLFPELYLSGYFLDREIIQELSEEINGESISTVREYARRYSMGVIIGFPEKDNSTFYNTAAFINKDGSLLGIYRKIHLYDHERDIFSPGKACPVFDLPEGRVGLMITYDMEFPEMARLLALKGCQLLMILTANMVPYQTYQSIYIQARAMENQVFVAATNKVGLEHNVVFFGESEAVHPNGNILYKSCNNEDLAIVDIDFSETESSKGLLNYLVNRRIDIYKQEGFCD